MSASNSQTRARRLTPKQRVLKKWPDCKSVLTALGWHIYDPYGGHFGRNISDSHDNAASAWADAARSLT